MGQDYTYIVARLRAMEAEMPDPAWFQRLVRTPVGGLLPMVREFFHGFEQVGSLADFEVGLEAERVEFMSFIAGLLSDEATITFLGSDYDFDNAIQAWKAAKLGREPVLSGAGLVDRELIQRGAAEGDRGDLPGHIGSLLEALEHYDGKDGLTRAQYAGEAMKYRFLLGAAPGDAARDYMRSRIDLMNIGTLIRLKRTHLRAAGTEEAMIDGGSIGRDRFLALLGEPEDELYSFLHFSDYRGLLRLGLGQEADPWRIDAASRRFLLGTLKESRLRFFDLAPLLYHIELRARNEYLTRMVLTGKSNGMPEERILERVDLALVS
jgi:V/A-type H+-transporting ATPase subunit C